MTALSSPGVVAPVEQRVMVQRARLGALHVVRVRDAAGVRELDADEQVVDRREVLARGCRPAASRSAAISARVSSTMMSWMGLPRPSGQTAIASAPKISLAPLSPQRCQRRRVRSVGRPSAVQSQPSMGRIAKRLPTVLPLQHQGLSER